MNVNPPGLGIKDNNNPTIFKNKVSRCLTSHEKCLGVYDSIDGRYILKCCCSCGHNSKIISDNKRPHSLVGAQGEDTDNLKPFECSDDTSDDSETSVTSNYSR